MTIEDINNAIQELNDLKSYYVSRGRGKYIRPETAQLIDKTISDYISLPEHINLLKQNHRKQ